MLSDLSIPGTKQHQTHEDTQINIWKMARRKEKENQKKKKREGGGFKIEGWLTKADS